MIIISKKVIVSNRLLGASGGAWGILPYEKIETKECKHVMSESGMIKYQQIYLVIKAEMLNVLLIHSLYFVYISDRYLNHLLYTGYVPYVNCY